MKLNDIIIGYKEKYHKCHNMPEIVFDILHDIENSDELRLINTKQFSIIFILEINGFRNTDSSYCLSKIYRTEKLAIENMLRFDPLFKRDEFADNIIYKSDKLWARIIRKELYEN